MHWFSGIVAFGENEEMTVVQINIFLVVSFDGWCVHSSRFKNFAARSRTLQRETKTEKRKEKAFTYGWQASKARSNGINEGKCGGKCLCRKFLLCGSCGGNERPAQLWLYLLFVIIMLIKTSFAKASEVKKEPPKKGALKWKPHT